MKFNSTDDDFSVILDQVPLISGTSDLKSGCQLVSLADTFDALRPAAINSYVE